ncbi:MAG: tRNA pseudouridine(38-40) synthase TruA [Candidatus Margulisiibacteriota bacterium]
MPRAGLINREAVSERFQARHPEYDARSVLPVREHVARKDNATWGIYERASRYQLTIAYDGSGFAGFQKQTQKRTVQGELEDRFGKVFGEFSLTYAGRTDTGVHAVGQVLTLEIAQEMSEAQLSRALQGQLPSDIQLMSAKQLLKRRHARFDAKRRQYRYVFTNGDLPVYLRPYVARVHFAPDITVFPPIRTLLEGTHDFSNFKNTGSDETRMQRTLYRLEMGKRWHRCLYADKRYAVYYIDIEADGFLRRMVRHIVGAIFSVMQGRLTLEQLRSILTEPGILNKPYTPAPAQGLCLVHVVYDEVNEGDPV